MEPDMMDEQEMEDEDANTNYREELQTHTNDVEENPHGLALAGLEDSDADDEPVIYCLIGIELLKTLLSTHYPPVRILFCHMTNW
jgi:predicted NACHT family NTPase